MTDGYLENSRDAFRAYLEGFQKRLVTECEALDRAAGRWGFLDMLLRAVSAVLAVAAPALVTYKPSPGASVMGLSPENFQVFVIGLVGIAGASVTLQAVFAFDRKYANSKSTAANLREICDRIEIDLLANSQNPTAEGYAFLREGIKDVFEKHRAITVRYVEEEVNTILKTQERVKELQGEIKERGNNPVRNPLLSNA